MKIRLILCFLLLFSLSIYAEYVPCTVALQVGTSYFSHLGGSIDSVPIVTPYPASKSIADLYILTFEPRGFVIVAADDRSVPILAYSLTATIALELPPQSEWLLSQYSQSIRQIQQHPEWSVHPEWAQLRQGDFPAAVQRSVAPLLCTGWNQNWPYNSLCPEDPDGPGNHAYAGAVATAMGQILRYWNHPVIGSGSHSYNSDSYGMQSADFGNTVYDWSAMADTVITENSAVSTLLYHCGVAVDMEYGTDCSVASSALVRDALVINFGYTNTALHYYGNYYSTAQWTNLLRTNLDQMRPVYYCGQNAESSHAFVIDGYQGTSYFHVNWGWSGAYDGYYYVSNLSPGTASFIQNQSAIMNICPVIPATYSLTGTVHTTCNTALENVVVTIDDTNHSGSTDANGNYCIAGVSEGVYFVTATKEGYHAVTTTVEIGANQSTVQDFTMVELEPVANADHLAGAETFSRCYPNPFRRDTNISLGIAKEQELVVIEIYEMRGRKIHTLYQGAMNSGKQVIHWDATDNSGTKVSSGLYLCRITIGDKQQILKMMLVQ
ncbi:MAG: hypothetical protein CVU48_04740 [Candidatus Cloacimonetes bacterium HGW-Cloacimonetes-1]|jgi:hypothetical protein|nr:MAG: hypothetical protein CVU48_04740 [Candidatus Cloacimonetes bacterium HGW-Cloacimonetes-1]